MKSILASAVVTTVGVCSAAAANHPEPISTEYGLVQGVAQDGLTVYKGIPFAAPPIGGLRWRPPQPAAKWKGVRVADKFGPGPFQGDGNGNVSEDCLYLNIWTLARSDDERVPYVFQTLHPDDPKLTPGDRAIFDTVPTYWANFAKRGDPNGPDVPAWPEFTSKNPKAMHFHNNAFPVPVPVPGEDSLKVLDAYFAWRMTPEGAVWAK